MGSGELRHDAAVPGHVREAMALGEHLDPPQPGILLGDCSCGVTYMARRASDGDEYGPLEEAHREHVAAARLREAMTIQPEGDESTCSHCGEHITLLGGEWVTDDGQDACTDTSARYVPHKPMEG